MDSSAIIRDAQVVRVSKRFSVITIGLSFLLYFISVPLLFEPFGGAVVGFLVVPIIVVGWHAGMKVGFLYGFTGGLLVNSCMLAFLYHEWTVDVLLHHQGVPGLIMLALLGGGSGYFRELRDRYIHEINARKTAQKELEFSRKRIERILRTIPSAVFSVDFQQRITSWNNAAEHITGLAETDVLGKKCVEIWDCAACHQHCGVLDDMLEKPVFGKEVDIVLPDGRSITIVKNVDAFYDEKGSFAGGVESFIDVTQRKQMEREIKETARGFQTLFNRSSEGLFLIDPQSGRYIEVNPALSTITGYDRDALLQLDHARLSPPADRDAMRDKMASFAANRPLDGFEARILRKDGSLRYVIFGATPIVWQGRLVQYGFIRDITSIKQMQLELEQKNREIVDLTNTISHDLRNPLTGIRGILEINCGEAAGKQADEKDLMLYRLALKEVDYMQDLLEDLLEAARIDTGGPPVDWKPVEIAGIITKIVELFHPQISLHTIAVKLSVEGVTLCADARAIEKVFMNLIGNAITYMGAQPDPLIAVSASDDGTQTTICVADNGMGIPSASLPLVFDKFRRGSNVGSIKGTGLGLSIVKGIVEAHGGTVLVESVEGAGSKFIVAIPHREDKCLL